MVGLVLLFFATSCLLGKTMVNITFVFNLSWSLVPIHTVIKQIDNVE